MMEKIRTAANSIIVKIIFGIIILAFIFTGVGGFLGMDSSANDEQKYIAKVDGEGISRSVFDSYAIEKTNNIQTMNLSDEYKQELIKNIRKNVLDIQINNYLVYRFAENLNIAISDEQVKNAIREQKVFFEENKFSNTLYLQLLANNDYTPGQYAEGIRSSLVPQQILNALFLTEFMLPVDSNISVLQSQERTAYVADFDSSLIGNKELIFSDEELKQYYDDHQNDFYKPERIKLKYVTNFRPDITAEIKVTEHEIEAEYKKNLKSKYTTAAKHLYSIISAENESDANSLYNELVNGADFNILASQSKKLSPFGNSNGSLGWFSIDDSLPTFLTEAGLSKKNSISKPIKTDDGYIIVKLNDVIPSKPMILENVSSLIRRDLAITKENTIYDEKEQKLQAALEKQPKSIAELAELSELPEIDSEWNYRNESFGIVRFPEIKDIAFSELMIKDNAPTGVLSDIIINGQYDSSFVFQVTEYRNEGVAPFDEIKDDIRKILTDNVAKQSFAKLVIQLQDDLAKKGSSDKISFANRYVITRNDSQLNPTVVDSIFSVVPSATNEQLYIVDKINDSKGVAAVLIKVENGQYADISEQIFPIILSGEQQNFIETLRSKAKIEIMPNANL